MKKNESVVTQDLYMFEIGDGAPFDINNQCSHGLGYSFFERSYIMRPFSMSPFHSFPGWRDGVLLPPRRAKSSHRQRSGVRAPLNLCLMLAGGLIAAIELFACAECDYTAVFYKHACSPNSLTALIPFAENVASVAY